MRGYLLALLLALVGALLSFVLISLAARSWSSMDDKVLFFVGLLPLGGVFAGYAVGAKLDGKKDYWPPPAPGKVLLALLGTTAAALSAYMCFAVVALIWSGEDVAITNFAGRLLDPSSIPSLASKRSSSSHGMDMSAPVHAGIVAFATLIMILGSFRKKT